MTSVQEHYDRHLGPIYGWMIGDFDAAKAAARDELRAAGLPAGAGRLAVDLGSGPGAHAIALAEAGYAVTAIDTCEALLDELRSHAGCCAVRCVHDDVLSLRRHCKGPVNVIVCMGDTLTHLASLQSVERLFESVSVALGPGGVFVATFRNYAPRGPEGVDRFFPVRQDEGRILTCVLEYQETTVTVYDQLHERTDDGWMLRVSRYSKVRLSPEWAASTLRRLGLVPTLEDGPRGMVRLLATRPA